MQLACENGDIEAAIKELELALPIVCLQRVIADRTKRRQKTSHVRRQLELLRALHLAREPA